MNNSTACSKYLRTKFTILVVSFCRTKRCPHCTEYDLADLTEECAYAPNLEVCVERRLREAVALVRADVEDELVGVEEVVDLVDHDEELLAVRPDLLGSK